MGFDILCVSKYLPERKVSNFDLEKIVDTSDEWIFNRTGIRNRYHSDDESTVDLAYNAALKLIEKSGVDKEKIRTLIVPTFTPDYMTPSVACLLQEKLELSENIFAFDMNAACSGFIYALKLADGILNSMEDDEYLMIVGSEYTSKFLNFEDRGTCILFGDGAGAALLKKNNTKNYVFSIGAKGGAGDLSCAGINKMGLEPYIKMDGKGVFRFATRTMTSCLFDVLDKTGVSKHDVDYVVCHQANSRIIEYAQKKLGLPKERFYMNIEQYGNTSSASIPIALAEMDEKNLLKRGMKILMVGFGGGLTWGGTLIEW